MILVNLANSWPRVATGQADAAEITLGNWAQISDDSLATHADAILGIYRNEIVTAFDITGWQRITEGVDKGRVSFEGRPSQQWKHLIGTENPGIPWTTGMARPVQYVDTTTLTSNNPDNIPAEEAHGRRTELHGYTLTVHADGNATVGVPFGKHITVVPGPPSEQGWTLVDVHDDAVFRAAFDQVDPEDWQQLKVLVHRLDHHDGSGSPGADNEVITDLRWLLRRAGLILHFELAGWEITDIDTASAEDCVRALSRIDRSEHWIEGSFAHYFEKPDSVGRTVLRRTLALARF
jgi:hypothetical protein